MILELATLGLALVSDLEVSGNPVVRLVPVDGTSSFDIVRSDGTVIGYLTLEDERDEPRKYIQEIEVQSAFYAKGYGLAALQALFDRFSRLEVLEGHSLPGAEAFWERIGCTWKTEGYDEGEEDPVLRRFVLRREHLKKMGAGR